MASKSMGTKSASFAKAGGKHMFGFRGTGTQTPGQSAQAGTGPKRGIAPKAGPTGLVGNGQSNKDYAGTQTPGVSAATKKGGDSKFAAGGSGRMFGNRGSRPAPSGQSGPNG